MDRKATEEAIRRQFEELKESLDERGRREFAATESKKLGWGGVAVVSRATGVARSTIYRGRAELKARGKREGHNGPRQIRRTGGGRKSLEAKDATLLPDLEKLVDPGTRGDPESPLRWTTKSLRRLAKELKALGHRISRTKVGELLHSMGFSLQANRKTLEGTNHPDRNAQFEYINARTKEQLSTGNPAISVDTKKKELVGDFKNGGREWRPKSDPEKVNVHDFPSQGKGRASPYGVYDIGANEGWVSVGISHDTASFAAATIQRWWWSMGDDRHPDATELLITADCGGSNGYRLRLWKLELQHLANALAIPVTVCHFPPGTSKWNKIEHRLFSFITLNWRGKPLVSHQIIVKLIGSTTTENGLTVRCQLDETDYELGKKVADDTMSAINLVRHDFHGDWNYTVYPSDVAPPGRYPKGAPE